ncbi:hypothetical protein [Myxococcus landrumensis]|uniref:Lipoprotein n=1 Tax=Myxococcus landrumensis TaxID=2813577 RepID=A0ABX7NHA7_9BACT|nr:hypothetical protein [Myxococcus landrumus]QSQ17811.1 hypothetical protein JY572_18015 [Myxococcus landrumus]
MSSSVMKSLVGGIVLLSAPVAFAGSSTTIPAFNTAIAAARATTSPGGTAILRSELSDAVDGFLFDDGHVDAAERAYLGDRINNASFNVGLTAFAKYYLIDFHELNDGATTHAPLWLTSMPQTPAALYGASGALANASTIVEGEIPVGQSGVANQFTLTYKARAVFGEQSGREFFPITPREVIARFSASMENGTASPDEVDGAMALISQISLNSKLIYVSDWYCREYCGSGGPGSTAGYTIAAVSANRRFVRMVNVRTWSE